MLRYLDERGIAARRRAARCSTASRSTGRSRCASATREHVLGGGLAAAMRVELDAAEPRRARHRRRHRHRARDRAALAADGLVVVTPAADPSRWRRRRRDRRRRPLAVAGDLRVPADAATVVRAAADAFGGLHVVVNNAGAIRRNMRLHEIDVERWDEQMAINLRGPFLVLHAALPELLQAERRPLRSSTSPSTLAGKPAPGIAPYAAAKGGLLALTRALAIEYGGDGIRCNAVLPAVVEDAARARDRPNFERAQEAMAAAYPLGRLGEPEDVAEAIR